MKKVLITALARGNRAVRLRKLRVRRSRTVAAASTRRRASTHGDGRKGPDTHVADIRKGVVIETERTQTLSMGQSRATVAAVAGRRVGAPDQPERFPVREMERVAEGTRRAFTERGVVAIVASAASGADIVALEAALLLHLPTRIVLPCAKERFRKTSVEDRGQEWSRRYDRVVAEAESRGEVVVLAEAASSDDDAYARATKRILLDTVAMSRALGARPIAITIWDDTPHEVDATRDLLDEAERLGLDTLSIRTIAKGAK
jgi:hypothetical protein